MSALARIVQMDNMPSGNITKGPHGAELDKNGAVRVLPEGHARLEQHVGSGWSRQLSFVGRIACFSVRAGKSGFIVWRQQHHDGGGLGEGPFQHLADVRGALLRLGDGLRPLDRLKAQSAQEGSERLRDLSITSMHHPDGCPSLGLGGSPHPFLRTPMGWTRRRGGLQRGQLDGGRRRGPRSNGVPYRGEIVWCGEPRTVDTGPAGQEQGGRASFEVVRIDHLLDAPVNGCTAHPKLRLQPFDQLRRDRATGCHPAIERTADCGGPDSAAPQPSPVCYPVARQSPRETVPALRGSGHGRPRSWGVMARDVAQ